MLVFLILGKYSRGQISGLSLRASDVNYSGTISFVDVVAMQHNLRTVGELYDFVCEQGLLHIADYL